ncbi:uncharacterized protein LOC108734958 [Agrilus planipennis]|uniref:Uncharacterized protein LOC108734958 n=1 Tax=Agrilus planipennis TaxID=224129 RepID=A0A1W4WE79_AGRPL|nr:uncharacterized protein LOC108734958 [Agrilus planipennis]
MATPKSPALLEGLSFAEIMSMASELQSKLASSHRAAEPIGCAMSESQHSATPIGPSEHERVRSNSFVSCASEASVMECSSESGKRKKTTPWCDDEPECLSAAENKKMRRRDSGETCRTYDYSGVGTFEGGDH